MTNTEPVREEKKVKEYGHVLDGDGVTLAAAGRHSRGRGR
jgi:hypothetical protein